MTNATIKQSQFSVETEILAKMSSHIELLIKSGTLDDELSALYTTTDWDTATDDFDDNNDGSFRIVHHDDGKVSIEDCIDGDYIYQWYDDVNEMVKEFYNDGNGDDNDLETREPYEFWLVSAWLYGKLEEYNEPVAIINDLHIWGRCTTGQAIKMDWVIQEIERKQIEKYGY